MQIWTSIPHITLFSIDGLQNVKNPPLYFQHIFLVNHYPFILQIVQLGPSFKSRSKAFDQPPPLSPAKKQTFENVLGLVGDSYSICMKLST